MTIGNISLFQAMNAKMDYLSQRQTVISQNVANADTPGYRPSDLEPQDFRRFLKNISSDQVPSVALRATNEKHLPLQTLRDEAKEKTQKRTYEVAPAGNAVVLEEQMMTSNDIQLNYNLMVNLYREHVGMIRTALGRNK